MAWILNWIEHDKYMIEVFPLKTKNAYIKMTLQIFGCISLNSLTVENTCQKGVT